MEENKSALSPIVWIILAIILLCCCCCVILAALGYYGYSSISNRISTTLPVFVKTYTITEIPLDTNYPTDTPVPSLVVTPAPPAALTRVPVDQISNDTLTTLEDSVVPVNDLRDLACRLEDKCSIPETVPSGPFTTGAKQKLWVSDTDTAKSFQIDATLQYVTAHAYFWVENGVDFNMDEAKKLVDAFENKMYPTDREFFGSEWTPGVDNDVHIYLVYARGIGGSVAGYFSSPDEYSPQAYQYSNAHEMFVFNADNSALSSQYTYGVLAHEFQHMIHWKQDRNETSWINEGFSELAVLLNGYYTSGAASEYTNNPDVQLNDWGPDPGTNGPHYGSAFMFLAYFLDRFGKEATQQVVHDQLNGFESIDDVLKSINAKDGVTGQPVRADDVFMDWAVTNYLLDGSVGDGRYTYKTYTSPPQTHDTTTISNCPGNLSGDVHQYGVDYIHISCSGKYTLHFEGDTQTGLLPADPSSGKYAFWSNKGDESDMTLTHDFDFSGVSAPITLQYQTWYDLEKDYDYVFLEASTDGGKTWQIIKTPSCTTSNPSGNSYGCGYNAKSSGWINEKVDLGAYAGKKVQVRYEYVTDAAVNGEGFMLDDVSIPEIKYSTDFEKDDGGWQAAGFVRVENVLPQTFRLDLILKGSKTTVQTITVNPDQTADITLDLGGDTTDAILVISGTTRFTRIVGDYNITIK
ncbi:MAG: hypothetical protein WA821_19430 [Anaerolineales bacterium]